MSAADARPGTDAAPGRWPASAIVAVAACCIAIVLLALVNVLAVPIAGDGYDPDVGGTVADWFAAAATAIAVPAAMLIGIRQHLTWSAVLCAIARGPKQRSAPFRTVREFAESLGDGAVPVDAAAAVSGYMRRVTERIENAAQLGGLGVSFGDGWRRSASDT